MDGIEQCSKSLYHSIMLVGFLRDSPIGFQFWSPIYWVAIYWVVSSSIIYMVSIYNHQPTGVFPWQDPGFPPVDSKHLVGDHSLSRPPAITKAGHTVVGFLIKWDVNHPRMVGLWHLEVSPISQTCHKFSIYIYIMSPVVVPTLPILLLIDQWADDNIICCSYLAQVQVWKLPSQRISWRFWEFWGDPPNFSQFSMDQSSQAPKNGWFRNGPRAHLVGPWEPQWNPNGLPHAKSAKASEL
jgi:hypothetical protein